MGSVVETGDTCFCARCRGKCGATATQECIPQDDNTIAQVAQIIIDRLTQECGGLRAERDALQLELIAAKPLYSRRKLEAERDALALQVLQLTNERDDARARMAT